MSLDKLDDSISNKDVDFYFENGMLVMTKAYHLRRGYCCDNKCRHCPYRHNEGNTESNDPL